MRNDSEGVLRWSPRLVYQCIMKRARSFMCNQTLFLNQWYDWLIISVFFLLVWIIMTAFLVLSCVCRSGNYKCRRTIVATVTPSTPKTKQSTPPTMTKSWSGTLTLIRSVWYAHRISSHANESITHTEAHGWSFHIWLRRQQTPVTNYVVRRRRRRRRRLSEYGKVVDGRGHMTRENLNGQEQALPSTWTLVWNQATSWQTPETLGDPAGTVVLCLHDTTVPVKANLCYLYITVPVRVPNVDGSIRRIWRDITGHHGVWVPYQVLVYIEYFGRMQQMSNEINPSIQNIVNWHPFSHPPPSRSLLPIVHHHHYQDHSRFVLSNGCWL